LQSSPFYGKVVENTIFYARSIHIFQHREEVFMSNSVDFKINKIVDYLYRKKNKISSNISVEGRRRGFRFELTLSKSDYTTVTVNGNRCYIIPFPQNSMLPEDETLSYIADMPFSEKMAFVDSWKDMRLRLERKMVREGNLGLTFGNEIPKSKSPAGK
jgi:hypothetical protein